MWGAPGAAVAPRPRGCPVHIADLSGELEAERVWILFVTIYIWGGSSWLLWQVASTAPTAADEEQLFGHIEARMGASIQKKLR